MAKILPIVNTALAALALIVGVIVLLQVGGIKSSMIEGLEEAESAEQEEIDVTTIPIAELEEFNMDENFILTYDSLINEGKKVNVVLKIGFAIHNIDEDTKTIAITALTSQGKIIRDRIRPILTSKDASYFTDLTKEEELKKEILVLVQEIIGNKAVIDIYFDPIISER